MPLVTPVLQSSSGVPVISMNSTLINATLAYTTTMSSASPSSAIRSASSVPIAISGMIGPQTGSYEPHFPAIEPQALGLIIIALVAMLLDIPVLTWHVRSKNIAASSLVAWIMINYIFNFINPIIWPNDDWSHQWKGYGLCDIEVKLQVGSYVGLTGALLAIMRDLCHVMNTKRITLVPSQKRRMVNRNITGTLCFGFPILVMSLHYIFQNTRYYLFTLSGCDIPVDNSWVAVVLLEMWPPILATAAAGFAVLLCYRMHRYRSEFGRLLAISNTTKSRFLSLFILSTMFILVFLPLQLYVFVRNLEYGVGGYHWSWTHPKDWGFIQIIPTFGVVCFDRWIQGAAAISMFFLFGLGDDALKMYRHGLRKCGFGKIFPAIQSDGPIRGFSFGMAGTWNSLNSKAKALLRKRKTHTASTDVSGTITDTEASMPRTSVSTSTPTNTNEAFSPRSKQSFGDSPKKENFHDVLISTQTIFSHRSRTSKDTNVTGEKPKEDA